MSKAVVSPDISVLDFSVLFDISGTGPVVTLENLSTQENPANLDWIIELYSPSGTPIHKGVFSAPDYDNGWEDPFVKSTGFPKPNNQIEWSGNPYKAIVKVKDSNGDIFELEKQVKVCKPTGNDQSAKNTFGAVSVEVKSLCSKAQLWVEDKTNYGYQGKTGEIVSKTFKLFFPEDETGTAPDPKTVNNFNSTLISITQSGSGYRYFASSIFDYDMGDNVTIRVKYLFQESFTIYCHLDITPIACELQKLQASVTDGSCKDSAAAQELLNKITPKLLTAMIGIQYPQSGINPFKIVEEINEMAGWNCECCPNGVVPLAAIAANDIAYNVNASGGLTGNFESDGSTVTLNIAGVIYTFELCEGIPSTAFSITPTENENNKSFCFNVNIGTLTSEILTAIGANTSFRNTLNSLINTNSGEWKLSVDMKCLNPNQKTCEFTFATPDISALSEILIKTISFSDDKPTVPINFIFDLTNAAALETLLNTMFSGETFSVDYNAGILTISITTSNLAIAAIEYFNGTTDLSMAMSKECTSSTTVTANVFAQSVVNWICGMILSQVKAGKLFIIKKLSGIGGSLTDLKIVSTDNASLLFTTLINEYNNLASIVQATKETTCENLQTVYTEPEENVAIESSDTIHGEIAGNCAKIPINELGALIFKMAQNNQDVKTEFCKASTLCASPICAAVTNMDVTYDPGTQTLTATIQNTGALKYRLGYAKEGLGRPALTGIQEVDATAGATTEVVWNGVAAGTYRVVVWALCASGESQQYQSLSESCVKPTSFSVEFDSVNQEFNATFDVPAEILNVKLEIGLPNGGTHSIIHLVSGGNTITWARPASISGNYTFTLKSVCDVDKQWYSEPMNPVVIDVPAVSTCPLVTNVQISNVGENSVTVSATKPAGNNIGGFKLRLTNQSNSVVSEYISNNPGGTVTWNVSGLTSGTEYAIEIITLCYGSEISVAPTESAPVAGNNFITQASGANNSSIVNDSVSAPTSSFEVLVNGAVVHSGTILAAGGGVSPFTLDNIAGASVEIRTYGVVLDGNIPVIVSNAVNYNADVVDLYTAQWNSVDIVGGMTITFVGVAG